MIGWCIVAHLYFFPVAKSYPPFSFNQRRIFFFLEIIIVRLFSAQTFSLLENSYYMICFEKYFMCYLEFYQQFACVGGDMVFSESFCEELQKNFFQKNVN